MDILSDALDALRTGRPAVVRTEARAPWAVRFRPIAGAGFHVVAEGDCLLLPPESGAGEPTEPGEPLALGTGDIVFLRRGSGHTLCDTASTAPIDFVPDKPRDTSPIGRFTVPGDGAAAVLVCGAYQLDVERRHPALGDLPDVIHLPAGPGRHPALRSAVDQLCVEIQAPQPGSDTVVATLVDLLLLYILRSWYAGQPKEEARGWAAALDDPVVAPALQAIHDDPGHPWTVESLGMRAGLSRAAFARRFGMPPGAYRRELREAAGR